MSKREDFDETKTYVGWRTVDRLAPHRLRVVAHAEAADRWSGHVEESVLDRVALEVRAVLLDRLCKVKPTRSEFDMSFTFFLELLSSSFTDPFLSFFRLFFFCFRARCMVMLLMRMYGLQDSWLWRRFFLGEEIYLMHFCVFNLEDKILNEDTISKLTKIFGIKKKKMK